MLITIIILKLYMWFYRRIKKAFIIIIIIIIVMTHNSSINFKLINFLLGTYGSHQSPNFDTFECSGENLLNSSCHFSNHKTVVLQILHYFPMSWKITPLYFFSSNSPNSCRIWNNKSVFLQIVHHPSGPRDITPL